MFNGLSMTIRNSIEERLTPTLFLIVMDNPMNGDVGMSRHEKERELRQEIIDNPISTPLFMKYAAILLFVGTGDAILG